MIDERRLNILTESAKYDVSCSSSGSKRKNEGGIGNAAIGGICHSFTPDGRCISLLKILMSNDCIYTCKYCPNRAGEGVERATATPDEICELTTSFYKRNYIEGLFLSSAVYRSPDTTMELLLLTVKKLRTEYQFNGYIHLKGIPNASTELIDEAKKLVDRMSYNIELPSESSLKLLAPQKTKQSLLQPMTRLRNSIMESKADKSKHKKRVLPAGQTTQMIIGATPETDGQIVRLSQALYRKMDMRRVYYSAYMPVVQDTLLPTTATALTREHRLYQADWLLRFYGFDADELLSENENLSENYDPKTSWALKHLDLFPIEVNKADLESLLRTPGIGTKGAYRIIQARKTKKLDFDDLIRLKIVLLRAKHFITCCGKFYGAGNEQQLKNQLLLTNHTNNGTQLSFFDGLDRGVISGQL